MLLVQVQRQRVNITLICLRFKETFYTFRRSHTPELNLVDVRKVGGRSGIWQVCGFYWFVRVNFAQKDFGSFPQNFFAYRFVFVLFYCWNVLLYPISYCLNVRFLNFWFFKVALCGFDTAWRSIDVGASSLWVVLDSWGKYPIISQFKVLWSNYTVLLYGALLPNLLNLF